MYFAEGKFAAQDEEALRPEMLDLGPAAQWADDVPSDDELIFSARALHKVKALGVDEIPCEAFRDEGPLRDALFELIRTIWRQEDIPKDMVIGLFVMIYKFMKPHGYRFPTAQLAESTC
jgi:hypothetical protein